MTMHSEGQDVDIQSSIMISAWFFVVSKGNHLNFQCKTYVFLQPYVVPLRILMLLGGGMIAVFGFELVHLEGAGPLGVCAAAFVCAWLWSTQGWKIEEVNSNIIIIVLITT